MMFKAIFLTLLSLFFLGLTSSAQHEEQLKKIKFIFKDYNANLASFDSFEIKHNTGGAHPSITLFSDFEGKLLIKRSNLNEQRAISGDYYYSNDTIQFVYFQSYETIDHWTSKEIRFKRTELRYYFDKGEVFKVLIKEFNGIEGKDDNFNMSTIKNSEINHKTASEAQWSLIEREIHQLLNLYISLRSIY